MTDFNEIYCLNLTMKNDPRLAEIPLNMYYSLCWKYLQVAISRFQYESLPDITDNVPFYELDYEYECNGVDTEFALNSSESIPNPNFVISQEYGTEITPITSYTYDGENNKIILDKAPLNGAILKISEFEIGYFNADLNYREKEILAQGMLIPFLEENRNRESLLNQFVYGGSVKIHSQAEHLKTVENALKEQIKIVNNLIIDYTYRANTENYNGLGTRKAPLRNYPNRGGN
ncbi:MAG: hypothetical protein J6T10_24955 [Methanobrevibacter sp.]|nr:hypothetical protein [Methanobrevibacter sp.]